MRNESRGIYDRLPDRHYHNVRWLRDALAFCFLLEPSLALLPRASRIQFEQHEGHAVADLLAYARTARRPCYQEVLAMRLIEVHEVLRLVEFAEGKVWQWYSEWYAAKLQQLIELECTYSRLALSYDDPLGSGDL